MLASTLIDKCLPYRASEEYRSGKRIGKKLTYEAWQLIQSGGDNPKQSFERAKQEYGLEYYMYPDPLPPERQWTNTTQANPLQDVIDIAYCYAGIPSLPPSLESMKEYILKKRIGRIVMSSKLFNLLCKCDSTKKVIASMYERSISCPSLIPARRSDVDKLLVSKGLPKIDILDDRYYDYLDPTDYDNKKSYKFFLNPNTVVVLPARKVGIRDLESEQVCIDTCLIKEFAAREMCAI